MCGPWFWVGACAVPGLCGVLSKYVEVAELLRRVGVLTPTSGEERRARKICGGFRWGAQLSDENTVERKGWEREKVRRLKNR